MKNDYHVESLIFTKRYSIGHFWSPYNTINEGIFSTLFITADTPISCRYSVSNSYKIPRSYTDGLFRP